MRPYLLAARPDPATVRIPDDTLADLGVQPVVDAAANGDAGVAAAVAAALREVLVDPGDIRHRAQVAADVLADPVGVRELHAVAVRAIAAERTVLRGRFTQKAGALVHRSVRVLELFVPLLRELRDTAGRVLVDCRSDGLRRLRDDLAAEVDEGYLHDVIALLSSLRFDAGVTAIAQLGPGNKGTGYVLQPPEPPERGRRRRRPRPSADAIVVRGEDEAGLAALDELRNAALEPVAVALAEAAEHLLAFFTSVRDELAVHLGSVNLVATLGGRGLPWCHAQPLPSDRRDLAIHGLYEPGTALRTGGRTVGNDLVVPELRLAVVTGRNSGGKTTFLRALGLGQVLMQAGLVVPARSFEAPVATAVLTHFSRDEDEGLQSGRLDEELGRMRHVADRLGRDGLVLCNESFASTNEREGSDLAEDVLDAFWQRGARCVVVTHLVELGVRLQRKDRPGTTFLRASTGDDGVPNYRIVPGPPLRNNAIGRLNAELSAVRS